MCVGGGGHIVSLLSVHVPNTGFRILLYYLLKRLVNWIYILFVGVMAPLQLYRVVKKVSVHYLLKRLYWIHILYTGI